MYEDRQPINFSSLLPTRPQASATLAGSEIYPDIRGNVRFYQTRYGVVVTAEFRGLPNPAGMCASPIFGFHIHSGGDCTGNSNDPFANAMTHYNPNGCPHPYHAGDLPPIFGANGHAFAAFLTNRFTVREVLGKTLILHAAPDDFTTQPAGNSGNKIACGVIR